MAASTFRMRVLILAAYLLAVMVPALALGEGAQQSPRDHERMMTMAGHTAQMPGMDNTDDGAQMLLCQQHCLSAVAALPPLDRMAEAVARASEVEVGIAPLVTSLVIPPPGPPPKIAVI